ncbi:hypothetical protein LC087_19155 (plasmid) [Bacillus carboniphilus]|uniref:Phage tail protein n=1 Tax=Bacillus carboniphilus TaxID=86663 RepID=A0ABY9JYM5_9BACI|nr:hypothetical protein [Bacillus carboniphilus]WLR44487.1 hypothetical protein LC087_19155 [Bacillus carboniphilus]
MVCWKGILIKGVRIEGSTIVSENDDSLTEITADWFVNKSKEDGQQTKISDGFITVSGRDGSELNISSRSVFSPEKLGITASNGFEIESPVADRRTEAYFSVKALGRSTSGRWLKVAKINNTSDLGALEYSTFAGTLRTKRLREYRKHAIWADPF